MSKPPPDVYAVAPHSGRGGWSWYTGSAGWLYRLMLESLLGLRREGERLRISPCLPADWSHYDLRYRYGSTWYRIRVQQLPPTPEASTTIRLDEVVQAEPSIPLVDDQQEHRVEWQYSLALPTPALQT